MQKKQGGKKTARKRVTFTLDAPHAEEAILAGDFNDWNLKSHVMKKDDKGVWTKVAMLTPGTYEYKFLVDGEWRNDPRNEHTVANSFGSLNNSLTLR